MANRGVEWSFDQPIYILELEFGSGKKLYKTCLTKSGLGLMLAAAKADMKHWGKMPGMTQYAPNLATTYSILNGTKTWLESWKIDGP